MSGPELFLITEFHCSWKTNATKWVNEKREKYLIEYSKKIKKSILAKQIGKNLHISYKIIILTDSQK